jgi:hypothetical protein
VSLLSWDGQRAHYADLAPGPHILTNAGQGQHDPKAAYFGPRFAASWRPADPETTIKEWRALAAGDGIPLTDPAAIIARRELPDGRIWGSTSVTLVALGTQGIRYDFQPAPGDPAAWYSVKTG